MKDKIKQKSINLLLAINGKSKDFKNKKPYELTEEELKEIDTLLTRCNEIIKKEG